MKRGMMVVAVAAMMAGVCYGEGGVGEMTAGKVVNTVVEASLIVYSADGKLCATVGEDGHIRMWDAVTGELKGTLRGHEGDVRAMIFSDDGKRMVSVGADRAVKVWDVEKAVEVSSVDLKFADEGVVAIRPMGTGREGVEVAECTGNEVRIWDVGKGEVVKRIPIWREGATSSCVAWRADGKTFAAGSSAGGMAEVDPEKGAVFGSQRLPVVGVRCVAMSGDCIAAGFEDGVVWVWAKRGIPEIIAGGTKRVNGVAFDGKGELVAAGVGEEVKVWEVLGGKLIGVGRHPQEVDAVAMSPDGERVAVGDDTVEMRYWGVNRK